MASDQLPGSFQKLRQAIQLLKEALQSDHLTPYVESRIRSAISLLGESP